MLDGSSITLIVSGSISAYKSAYLLRELVKKSVNVRVVMTKSACEFITPLTMQTLSNSPVTTSMFDYAQEAAIGHIDLADNTDLILVAPASASIIAKAAHGIADDIATTILLASKAKKVFVPAMNVNMWENSITKENVETLRRHGMVVIEPDSGDLACGWIGAGRFPESDRIIAELEFHFSTKELSGSRVIVTAGPTLEPIDPIRYVSNRSTGKMGYALAQVARAKDAKVHLVSGPSSLKIPSGVTFHQVETAQQMHDLVFSLANTNDQPAAKSKQLIFMAAAVTDHRPRDASTTKVKQDKSKAYKLELEPCPDILKALGKARLEIEKSSGRALKLIGFNAETGSEEELLVWAKEKLQNKDVDLMVGNLAEDSFGKDTNRVWLLDRQGRQEEVAMTEKNFVAAKIIKAVLSA